MKGVVALLILLVLSACAPVAPSYRDVTRPMTSKAVFDPVRYAGRWYEIASFPTPFQKGCTQTQARYSVINATTLGVFNTCARNGATSQISGNARVSGPGRLEVKFSSVPFVKAPYWVLWVDEDYQTAVVGVPSGRAGWILNRAPTLRADRLQAARDVLAFNGYDLSRLQMTPQ